MTYRPEVAVSLTHSVSVSRPLIRSIMYSLRARDLKSLNSNGAGEKIHRFSQLLLIEPAIKALQLAMTPAAYSHASEGQPAERSTACWEASHITNDDDSVHLLLTKLGLTQPQLADTMPT